MERDKLEAYLQVGQRLFKEEGDQPSVIDKDEMGYKGRLIESLEKARMAVVNDRDDWAKLLREAVWHPENNITERHRNALFRPVLQDWLKSEGDALLEALKALWTEETKSAGDRVQAFLDRAPEHENFQQRAQKLTPTSYLLMALGYDYPPFLSKNLNTTYRYLGYPLHPPKGGLFETYEHELRFLDLVMERSHALGYERPKNGLEAQSLVWQMNGLVEEAMKNGTIIEPKLPDHLDALATELLLPPKFLREITDLLKDKKQVIFQGPPGTGKTHVARKLAECLAGDEDRVELVQFHPSYAYEDFVQGFRPTLEDGKAGFVLRDGPLLQMADQALFGDPDKMYFLIIDEINRGNLAKVFGELYFLLEYRGEGNEMRLQYSDAEFSMPENLYIIGTMNTADRSIALVDAALRRRFYFVEFRPEEEPIKGLLENWLRREAEEQEWSDAMDWLPGVVERANEKMGDQRRDAAIGPSYFMKDDIPEKLDLVWKHNVIPYVEEQIYDQRGRIKADFDLQTLRDEVKRASNESPQTEGDGEQGDSGETTAGNEGN